jgi:hypothetical protein
MESSSNIEKSVGYCLNSGILSTCCEIWAQSVKQKQQMYDVTSEISGRKEML